MKATRDPEGAEVKNLLLACPLAGRDVLEIGNGAGWLTRQYAHAVNRITGVDPSLPSLQEAKNSQLQGVVHVQLAQSKGEMLPFSPATFDAAIFSNSL